MFRKVFGRTFALIAMLAVMASSAVMPAAAEVGTIYAEMGRCKTNVSHFQVQLQSRVQGAPASDFPASVTLTFADGSVAEATSFLPPNFGTVTYRFEDPAYADKYLVSATAEFDVAKYPNYRFTVSARPCVPEPEPEPTFTVSGTILQHGNQKPVEGLEVCIVETGACTTTDANGSFSITGVESGTYTLVSDGPVYKPLTTSVTVDGADVYVDLTQYRGGGRN